MWHRISSVTYYPFISELSLYALNSCRMTKQRTTEIALCVIKCQIHIMYIIQIHIQIHIIQINFNLLLCNRNPLSLVNIHVLWDIKPVIWSIVPQHLPIHKASCPRIL